MNARIDALEAEISAMRDAILRLESALSTVVLGQEEVVEAVVQAVVAGGHVLLEGAPGLGKTLLVRTLASLLDLDHSRIQFTPDLMPADITGTYVVEEEGRTFTRRFQKGPVFTNVLLADEINRGTPKTQSALLEAMQERGVTAHGERMTLPAPFFVLATQNPIEMEGTYPLPEAQLDRFLSKVSVPFPQRADLVRVLSETTGASAPDCEAVMTRDELVQLQSRVREIAIAPEVLDHAAALVLATHPEAAEAPDLVRRHVRYGSSPRGAQALVLAGKVRALRRGAVAVGFDDLAGVARSCLRHRIILNFEGDAAGSTSDTLLDAILDKHGR